MTTDEGKHQENAETLLAHAQRMVEALDHVQASEKIWGAVAQTLKQIAERHGWEHGSHTDLGRIAGYLAAASGDDEIREGYSSANGFHRNFYEDEFEIDQIEHGVRKAEDTVARLNRADARIGEGARPDNGADSPNDYYARLRNEDANTTIGSLREQGLTTRESGAATRILNAADFPMVDDVSFKIGAQRRRVTRSGDGRPKVGRPTVSKDAAEEMDEMITEAMSPGRVRSPRYWPRR